MQSRDSELDKSGREVRRVLGERVQGPVIGPGDPEYNDVRRVWNAMIDRRPALIARCTGTVDVVEAVKFASEADFVVSIRGGGHNVAGNAVCEGGLMIDLSLMQGAHVNPASRTARVLPGSVLGVMDRETQLHGLVAPAGIVSHTGVAGLTLGGGQGWVSRKFGYTVDNLLSVDLVTADGEVLVASESENR